MKRKLALLLTVTMLATSVYTPWLANAAEFTSGEENSLYTEEKPETEELKKNRKQTQKKPEKRRYRKISFPTKTRTLVKWKRSSHQRK